MKTYIRTIDQAGNPYDVLSGVDNPHIPLVDDRLMIMDGPAKVKARTFEYRTVKDGSVELWVLLDVIDSSLASPKQRVRVLSEGITL